MLVVGQELPRGVDKVKLIIDKCIQCILDHPYIGGTFGKSSVEFLKNESMS